MSFFTNTGLRRSIRVATPDSSVTSSTYCNEHLTNTNVGTGIPYSYTVTFPRRSSRIATLPRVDYSIRAFERIVEDMAEAKFDRKYGMSHITDMQTSHRYNLRPRSTPQTQPQNVVIEITSQEDTPATKPRRSPRLAMTHTA